MAQPARPYLGPEERLPYLVDGLGNNRVAALLGVAKSQPSRWRAGKDRMNADNARSLLDLDYVMARLSQLMDSERAAIWLESSNSTLGTRPIDAIELRGPTAILPAIDAEEQGYSS